MSARHRLVRLLAPVACAALALTTPTATASTVEPAAAPGDVLSAQAIDAPGFPYANEWTITYQSTSATGEPITVSGTVIAPKNATADTPIVGYAPGTHGLGDQCAPSVHLTAGDEFEGILIHEYATRGFAVVVTDYEGIGTPGEHPYMAGRSEGQTTLDAVRAAQRLTDSGLAPGGPVAVVGYSQGGHGAGWAAEIAPDYAPEMDIRAYSVGAPPADLLPVAEHNDGGENVGLVMAAGYGMDIAYPELALAPYLNDEGRVAFDDIRDDCTDELTKYAGHKLTDYTTEDVLARPEWRSRVEEQALGGGTPQAPVLLYHSNGDEILPVEVSVALRSTWCDAGADVTFWQTDTGEHATTAAIMSPAVTGWVADRLAGKPAESNC